MSEKFSLSLAKALNPQQLEAAQCLKGPLLILAGAGSGKTRVLTYRMANIIASGLAAPNEILAVTFTNKAAREMENRIGKILRDYHIPVYERLWVSTFHALCARILREHIHLLEYERSFAIYDSGDQLSMIKKVCFSLNLDEKAYPSKAFAARINAAKTEGLTFEDVRKLRNSVDERTLKVFERYEQEMKRANALDFGDLLLKVVELFRNYPAILEIYQTQLKFLMVDEYQDTNRVQYLLVKMMAEKHRNLCVVGDEDQSIYSWRGADISNILDFESDFGHAKVVKLEQNYRSSGTVVKAATHLIKNNVRRKDKTLFTENPDGAPIVVREEADEYDEARFVVGDIARDLGQDRSPNDIAVFYRTNAQSRVLEEQLRARSIPYKIVGGIKFYERMEIKDIISYMRLLLNPNDDIAFKRVLNVPARGIGKTTADNLEGLAAEREIPLSQAAQIAVDTRQFNAGTTSKLRNFSQLIEGLRGTLGLKPLDIYHAIIDKTEYVNRLKVENSPEAEARIENLEEFDNAIAKLFRSRRVRQCHCQVPRGAWRRGDPHLLSRRNVIGLGY